MPQKFNNAALAKAIIDKRTRDNISVRAMREQTGMPITLIFRLEAETREPTLNEYAVLCEWLNVPLTHFFTQTKKHGKTAR
jgi:transcriptional regulator with XRE-family HTH domain